MLNIIGEEQFHCFDAFTGSGSVITQDVPAGAVALGRAPQVNKAGLAVKLFERLKTIKAAKGKA